MNIYNKKFIGTMIISLVGLMAMHSHAGEVDVTNVIVECSPECDFHVTLKHADTGWDHYANRWDVVTPDGKVIGKRVLYHPHVNEQPFTRSLTDVEIPAGVTEVIIKGNDSVHKQGGKEMRVKIPPR